MNENDIRRFLKDFKERLKTLKTIESSEYDISLAIKETKEQIEFYKNILETFTDEHKQLCESLKTEFPGDMVKDCDLKTLRELNRVMNDDSLTNIQKSTWYMLIVNYQK